MLFKSVVASALLASTVSADRLWSMAMPKRDLTLIGRQSQAFTPTPINGQGATCADAFGAGFVQCGTGNDCFNPGAGGSCCSEGYDCPSGSFCLVQGQCCPDGLDPASCAAQLGVTLPAGFSTDGVAAAATTSPATTSTTSVSVASPITTASAIPTISSNGTSVPTYAAPTTAAPVFTGAANANAVGGAFFLGLLGLVGNVL